MGNWKAGEHHRRNKNPNILEGLPSIAEYIGKSYNTTYRWILEDGLPATKTPRGIWYTHKGLILQWIYSGHQAELSARVRYTLEEDEIAALAIKMKVDPDEVLDMMHQEQEEQAAEMDSRREFNTNGKRNAHIFKGGQTRQGK